MGEDRVDSNRPPSPLRIPAQRFLAAEYWVALLLRSGRYREAASAFESRRCDSTPSMFPSYIGLGEALGESRADSTTPIAAYQEAGRIDPNNALWSTLAVAKPAPRQGLAADAITEFNKAIALDGALGPAAISNRGVARQEAGIRRRDSGLQTLSSGSSASTKACRAEALAARAFVHRTLGI